MRVLFVHQNFPGQYLHLAPAIAAKPGTEVIALAMRDVALPGVRVVRHAPTRGSSAIIHPLALDFETKVIRGESAALAALRLRAEGFQPDVICGHPGWGETLFLKDVWPHARLLAFLEFAYSASGADVGFDPELPPPSDEDNFAVRVKNAGLYLAMESADWLVSPTRWQARQAPDAYRDRISVIHDGIDTDKMRPDPDAFVRLGERQIRVVPGDEVVTFVNRNLEPYRGYPSFMRALPAILVRRPRARVVIVGGSSVSYGPKPPAGRSYRDIFLEEVKADLDLSRIHLVGNVPYGVYRSLLQVSAAHVYLTYPFVLSWSLLEAMAIGCAVVGSATPPVEEVVEQGRTGVLVDFFSPEQIADAVVDMLARPECYANMRRAARNDMVNRFDLGRVCLPAHVDLVEVLARGSTPVREVKHDFPPELLLRP